jgi:hypothetical protein
MNFPYKYSTRHFTHMPAHSPTSVLQFRKVMGLLIESRLMLRAWLTGVSLAVAGCGGGSAITSPDLPSAPITGWPSTENTGPRIPTTRTLAGAVIDDQSWFVQNKFAGNGTQADPYVIDRVLFTDMVVLGNWEQSNLTGRWVKFINCRFYGNPGNPTPGGSAFLWARDNAPFFIVEDSTLAPNQMPLPTGGTTTGTDKGIFSYVPFQVRRSNIYGTNIPIGFEIERDETTGVVIEDNYLHDIWSSAGDHTDIINGNSHASHVVVRHNYLDGIRVGNSYVTNAIGIYDDPVSSGSGVIEDWVIDRNYFDRAATMILSTTNRSRFLDPFILTNNSFSNRYSLARVIARSPSRQSGNVDHNGNALQF